MELRHLRTIVAVARHGSFTKAGEELHMAQSAVSQQIRELEQELDLFGLLGEFCAAHPGDSIHMKEEEFVVTWPVALIWRSQRRQPAASRAFLSLALKRAEGAEPAQPLTLVA